MLYFPFSEATPILDSVGQSNPEQMDYAISLINEVPEDIRDAVHDPYGVRAVIYCLIIDNQDSAIRDKQLRRLREMGDKGIFDLASSLLDPVKTLGIRFRLPLIDMALPSLRQLSEAQYRLFQENLLFLVRADNRIDLLEWTLQKILFHHLDAHFGRAGKKVAKFGSFSPVTRYIEVLLSMLAYACIKDKVKCNAAFANAGKELGMPSLVLLPREQINLDNLDAALDILAMLNPMLKPRFLKACLTVITQDQKYSPDEMELMRTIAGILDCPLPPYLG